MEPVNPAESPPPPVSVRWRPAWPSPKPRARLEARRGRRGLDGRAGSDEGGLRLEPLRRGGPPRRADRALLARQTREGLAHRGERAGARAPELSLRRESVGSAVGKARGNREIVLGDPRSDQGVYLQGSAALAGAVLEDDTRRRWCRRCRAPSTRPPTRSRVWASAAGPGGPWRAAHRAARAVGDIPRCWVGVLPSSLITADRLRRPGTWPRRLVDNLGHEPVEGGTGLMILLALLEGDVQ